MMRLRPGRPDIARYAHRFTVPAADSGTPLTVTWLGVSTLLVDDGSSALMTDGSFSRPPLSRVALGKVAPSPARVDGCLSRAKVEKLLAVVPVHTHIDHGLDSALVADRTGAKLIGGESAANLGRGYGLPRERVVVAVPGEPIVLGPFEITLVESRHSSPDRFPGVISEPVCPPVRASAYRCGEAWSAFVAHQPSGRRMLIQGSAGFVNGALTDRRADVVYLGVGQLGRQPGSYLIDYFRPLSKPLRALPYVADDLDASLRSLDRLAAQDGVALDLPTVWRREDPWT
jgi:L-ascorbate metabolism protein UlaG (beta-lactamase superfamily)